MKSIYEIDARFAVKVRRVLTWHYGETKHEEKTEHILAHSMCKEHAEEIICALTDRGTSSGNGCIYGTNYNYEQEFALVECTTLYPPCILLEDDTTVTP